MGGAGAVGGAGGHAGATPSGGAGGVGGEALGGAGGAGGAVASYCAADLEDELAPVVEGLLYMSESDRPFEPFVVADDATGPISMAHMLELLALPADTVIEEWTFDQFFTDYLLGQDERYAQMRTILEERMSETTVFRVNLIAIDVYLVGRTECGEVAGLHTVAIET